MWHIFKAEQAYHKSLYPIALIFHVLIVRYMLSPDKWFVPEKPLLFVVKIYACIIATATFVAIVEGIYGGINERGTPENRQRLHALLPVSAREQGTGRLLSPHALIWIGQIIFWTAFMAIAPHPLDRSVVWASLFLNGLMAIGYGMGFIIEDTWQDILTRWARVLQSPVHVFRGVLTLFVSLAVVVGFRLTLDFSFSPVHALALNLISLLPLYIGSTTFTRRKSYLF